MKTWRDTVKDCDSEADLAGVARRFDDDCYFLSNDPEFWKNLHSRSLRKIHLFDDFHI